MDNTIGFRETQIKFVSVQKGSNRNIDRYKMGADIAINKNIETKDEEL